MSALRAQVLAELRLASRQGEQLLASLGIPLLILVFFSLVDVLPTGTDEPVAFVAPGVLALAVMSSAMVSLGIGTGFERHYGVLVRLGTTPLGRERWVAAKVLTVLVIQLGQLAVLVPVALALGWSPSAGGMLNAVGALLLGTAAFAGLGLALAGNLSGLANLAVTNGLFVVLLLIGGVVVPLDELPALLELFAELLPAAALSTALHGSVGASASESSAWLVLTAWAVVTPTLAVRTFRWAPDRH